MCVFVCVCDCVIVCVSVSVCVSVCYVCVRSTHAHTRIHTITTPPPLTPFAGRMWGCIKCTFRNHPQVQTCEMCSTERQVVSEKVGPRVYLHVRRTNTDTNCTIANKGWRSYISQLHNHSLLTDHTWTTKSTGQRERVRRIRRGHDLFGNQ